MGRIRFAPAVLVVAFFLAPASWGASKGQEYKFKGRRDGALPNGPLISDPAGNLYGTTSAGGNGGGTVFEISPNNWIPTTLYEFTDGQDGASPGAGLIMDSQGNLYGTTTTGGIRGCCGTVFELSPNGNNGWAENTLYIFDDGPDGGEPSAGLVFDSMGNLYGTTAGGGVCNPGCSGVVFELSPIGNGKWSETVAYSFEGGADGYYAGGGVVLDASGNIYGTTTYGGYTKGICGAQGCGKVFELTPNQNGTWTENVLYVFTGETDGGYPFSGVVFDGAGNLYGETAYGGDLQCEPGGCGVVYQLSPIGNGSWQEVVVHRFDGRDGTEPAGGLTFDSLGNAYGTASSGGGVPACSPLEGCGIVFELSPASDGVVFSRLGAFNSNDGLEPLSGVIVDAAGNIYGTTLQGGLTCGAPHGCGVVFELTP
jgi:uncharacterized repeat protein (TIGR03803 family)